MPQRLPILGSFADAIVLPPWPTAIPDDFEHHHPQAFVAGPLLGCPGQRPADALTGGALRDDERREKPAAYR